MPADTLMRTRFASQLLSTVKSTANRSATMVVEHLLAVQAQDQLGMRLSVRPRCPGSTRADVDNGLNDGSLVVGWLNRGTLHLVRAADYWWLHAITTPQLRTGNSRRLAQEGVSEREAARGIDVVEKALAVNKTQTRAQLKEQLSAAGVETQGQALVHILLRACIEGIAVRGPMVDGSHAYVSASQWLGARPHIDVDSAYADLARRYLVGHEPADARDLAKWAGITLGAAKTGLHLAGGDVRSRDDGCFGVGAKRAPPPVPPPTLLGPYDPLLHGWMSRDSVVGEHRGIVTSNGLFRPFALVGGRAVATWRWVGGEVVLAPLESISASNRKALEADARDVARFLT